MYTSAGVGGLALNLKMDGVLGKLKNLDAYPKVNEDFFTRTFSGGVITVVSSIVMLCLFLSELGELMLYINLTHQAIHHCMLIMNAMPAYKSIQQFASDQICRPVAENEHHQRAISGHLKGRNDGHQRMHQMLYSCC